MLWCNLQHSGRGGKRVRSSRSPLITKWVPGLLGLCEILSQENLNKQKRKIKRVYCWQRTCKKCHSTLLNKHHCSWLHNMLLDVASLPCLRMMNINAMKVFTIINNEIVNKLVRASVYSSCLFPWDKILQLESFTSFKDFCCCCFISVFTWENVSCSPGWPQRMTLNFPSWSLHFRNDRVTVIICHTCLALKFWFPIDKLVMFYQFIFQPAECCWLGLCTHSSPNNAPSNLWVTGSHLPQVEHMPDLINSSKLLPLAALQ